MTISLDQVSVAKPCSANWDEMPGDERMRHCGMCKMNVYNLSEMTREEAEQFVQAREGRTCIQFYRRADGTMLTKDCPVGLKRIRQRMAVLSAGLAASIFLAAGSVLARMGWSQRPALSDADHEVDIPRASPAQAVKSWLNPPAPVPTPLQMAKGEMCVVAPAPVPSKPPVPATSGNE